MSRRSQMVPLAEGWCERLSFGRLNVFKTDYRAWREYGDGVVDRAPDEDDYVLDDVEANPRTRVGGYCMCENNRGMWLVSSYHCDTSIHGVDFVLSYVSIGKLVVCFQVHPAFLRSCMYTWEIAYSVSYMTI